MKISNSNFQISSTKNKLLLVIFLTIIGAFLRFYNLNWGAPYYFHPDERNIASSISQLHFPTQLNPHFFAYGSLPLYAVFFIGIVHNFFTSCQGSFSCPVKFEDAIIIGRIIASLLSLLIIPLIFLVGEKIQKGAGTLASLLSLFSIGYIQFAHFGTVEMWLTFFTLLLFYVCLLYTSSPKLIWSFLIGILLGILLSAKVSSIVFFIFPPFLFFLKSSESFGKKMFQVISLTILTTTSALLVFFLTNPYVLSDFTSFRASMDYESSVGLGTLPVFYTGEFINSLPIIFPLLSVYPFLINGVVLLFFVVAFIVLLPHIRNNRQLLLLYLFFLVTFLSQAFLYVKWTRYLLPTLPFIYLILSYFVISLKRRKVFLASFLVIFSLIFGISYFITAYVETDTRIQAASFAKKNIPPSSTILSEVYDLGIVPFNELSSPITLYNFYELDNHNPEFTPDTLSRSLSTSDYFILPSQRILKTRLLQPESFPIGHTFYSDLTSNKLRFIKIYESPCSLFCYLTYLGNPAFRFEETASVFERPTVMIYKKL